MVIVAVASGKGGTGKTTIATNLALSLADESDVQLLDCDTEEPNAHLFLAPEFSGTEEVHVKIPTIDEEKCIACGRCTKVCAFHAIALMGTKVVTFPELCHGCGGCQLVCPTGAIGETNKKIGVVQSGDAGKIGFALGKLEVGSPLAPMVVKAVRRHTNKQGRVIIDAPPGTSCPVVSALTDVDYCLLVTEPTPFGLNDLKLAVEMVRSLHIPFGVIINRSDYADSYIEEYCSSQGIPVLLKIPFDRKIAALYARGSCLVQEYPEYKRRFRELWQYLERGSNSARAVGD